MIVALASERLDRWIWWPTACTVAIEALFAFVGLLPGALNLPLSLLAILACPAMALLLIGAACKLAWQRRPRGAASALLALAAPVALVIPVALIQPYVHLGLMLAFGIGFIGPAPSEGQPVAIYDWSTGMVGGPSTFLIYDKTDAIASSQGSRGLPAWRENDFLQHCSGKSQHLTGHYYVCVE